MRAALLLMGVMALMLLQVIEVRRRLREPDVFTRGQYWRRLLTVAVLQVVLLLWLVGDSLMGSQPPVFQLAYWLGLILLAMGAAFSAVREMAEVSRQYNRQRADLFRREVGVRSEETARPERRGANTGNGRSV